MTTSNTTTKIIDLEIGDNMRTEDEVGEYEQLYWKWEADTYRLETCEFSENGEFHEMDYKTYLLKWAKRIDAEVICKNTGDHTEVTLIKRGDK